MAPDGQVAAYCIIWTDELTRIGHFDRGTTRTSAGLGKSLLSEGFRRFKSEGMTEAMCARIMTTCRHRYKSVGFQLDRDY
jgi:hypothetical protein